MSESSKRKWKGEPLVLFVEGYSDLTFYIELMEELGKDGQTFIQDLGGNGRTMLEKEAFLLLKPDNLQAIQAVAVLLDADDDGAAAFRSAQAALKAALRVDVLQPKTWVVGPDSKTKFGIFIVGGPDGRGEVESLAWEAWRSQAGNLQLSDTVEGFVKDVTPNDKPLAKPDKVRIGAMLSVRHTDDPRLGSGARAGVFDFASPAFADLRKFLGEM